MRATIALASATLRSPAFVTAMIRARRSVLDGRRSARPARSSSSTVTTIVVLSSAHCSATWLWVSSAPSAWASTQCARGETPSAWSSAVISVSSAWLACESRNMRSTSTAAAGSVAIVAMMGC